MQVPNREAQAWKTPMFEQYWRIRDTLGEGALLFYRMGDFFELFGADAVAAAPLLEVQLTARSKDADTPVPMCGVPVHAVDSYAEKVLASGYKIAICEQVSDPSLAKGKLVERAITRILTPGLPIDHSRLEAKADHWFFSISYFQEIFEVHALDLLGARYHAGTLSSAEELIDLIQKCDPKEILAPELWRKAEGSSAVTQILDYLKQRGRSKSLTYWSFSPEKSDSARTAFYEYLRYTQRCADEGLSKIVPEAKSLAQLLGQQEKIYARAPAKVLEQWAVFPNLFDLLDRCGSVLGSRRLRKILSQPLALSERIRARQELFVYFSKFSELREECRNVYDLERILGRFRLGVAAHKELIRLKISIDSVMGCLEALDDSNPALKKHHEFESLESYQLLKARVLPIKEKLHAALNLDVEPSRAEGVAPLIREGFDQELDRLRNIHLHAEDWLQHFEVSERERSGIPSLKVRYNRVFGFYIEIRKGHLEKVPEDYKRKQTTAQGERYTSPVLNEKEEEILSAASKLEDRAKKILDALQEDILKNDQDLRQIFDHFSWLDAILGVQYSVQTLARYNRWNMPTVKEGNFFFSLNNARHPVIEALQENFVANSLELGVSKKRILLLTGPNMAGKSTLMRQTGLCLLLAQCGLPVPAESLDFAPCNGFFSRMGAADRILEGESTFMVEMKESAEILRDADSNSLVLIDEIGRGTSTQDGLAIAQSVLEHIHNEVSCLCIFATHYHELSDSVNRLDCAINASMAIREWKGDLIFLRKVKFEPAASSYGIYVAKIAGLPKTLVQRAQKILTVLKNSSQESTSSFDLNEDFSMKPGQLDIFSSPVQNVQNSERLVNCVDHEMNSAKFISLKAQKFANEIQALDLNEMSPRQAWEWIEAQQRSLEPETITSDEGPELSFLGKSPQGV